MKNYYIPLPKWTQIEDAVLPFKIHNCDWLDFLEHVRNSFLVNETTC